MKILTLKTGKFTLESNKFKFQDKEIKLVTPKSNPQNKKPRVLRKNKLIS